MGKRCLQSRPRGPAPKSAQPGRAGKSERKAVERRRWGTTLFVCSVRSEGEGSAVPADLSWKRGVHAQTESSSPKEATKGGDGKDDHQ